MSEGLLDGISEPSEPIELSFPLPHAPAIRINIQLTVQRAHVLLFMTTTSSDSPSAACSLGSFVYALPNRFDSSSPLSTPLYIQSSTLDFATRMAKLLAKRTGLPTYVGNSMSFTGAGRGGDVEEEMAGFRMVVTVVTHEILKAGLAKDGQEVNGMANLSLGKRQTEGTV